MIKPIKEIRRMIEDARPALAARDGLSGEYAGHRRTLDALVALLEFVADHESLINRIDGELVKITDTKRSVPAEWYRASVHTNLKLTHELGALLQAVEGFSDWLPHVIERRQQLLAADSEYQRLLAEETPTLTVDQPIWGKGLEDLAAVQNSALQEHFEQERRSESHYDNEKAKTRKYRLVGLVHPETVVRWFLDLHHYWFDGTLGTNLFDGMRDDAFKYLCGWIETGELPPSHTMLEIHLEAKFDEWLKSSWKLITAKCLAVRDGVDFAISARCTFDAGHDGLHSWAKCPNCSGTIGHPGPCTMSIPTGTDYTKALF